MTSEDAKAKRAPKPKIENKRGSLTIRLRDEVRRDLEASAHKYGRSLSEEMECRMEISLANKMYLQHEWGDDFFRIASAMATALARIEQWTGKRWSEDEKTADIFKATMPLVARNFIDILHRRTRKWPAGKDFDEMTPDELAETFAALSGLAPPRGRFPEVVVTDD